MASSASRLEFLKDLFSPFGEITVRKMFGGAGIYCDGLIFAIEANDAVWFKVDDVSREAFTSKGLEPFTIEMNGKTGSMSYYNAPEDIYDDADALNHWMQLALGAAARNKRPAKNAKKKKR